MRSDSAVAIVAPGGAIAERYWLLGPLGAGASATVWAAVDDTLGRQVALKLLTRASAFDEDERAWLRREARALAALTHPNIVIVYDYLETPGLDGAVQPVLVTELLEGEGLEARLERGPLPWAEALRVCGQLADALAAAHRAEIVHRDVTPSNVMLTEAGAKLLDFGIAQDATQREQSEGMAVGTPMCMAPEQVLGRGAVPGSDVYALGCVLHWCLTGRPPYTAPDLVALSGAHLFAEPPALDVPGLPAEIDALRRRCLAKEAGERPTSAEVRDTLAPYTVSQAAKAAAAVVTGTPVVANTAIVVRRTEPSPGRHAGAQAVERHRRSLLPLGLLTAVVALVGVLALTLARVAGGGQPVKPPTAAPSAGRVAPGAMGATAPQSAAPTARTRPGPGAGAVPPPQNGASPAAPSAAASAPPSIPSVLGMLPVLPALTLGDLGYVQGITTQVQVMILQGPLVLDPTAGQNLLSELSTLRADLAAVQGNNGVKQARTALSDITVMQQTITNDEASGLISPPAASLLNGELQPLASQVAARG
jgi:hypothetical protein